MKIVVTGSTGFIGSVVFNMLVEKGYNALGLARSELLAAKYLKGGAFHIGDINDVASLEELFETAKDVIVIHCAGLISIGNTSKSKMMEVNFEGTKNITDLAVKYNAKLIYVSSVEAIPKRPGVKTEADFYNDSKVTGIYGKSKRLASLYVYEAMRKGLRATIVFPSGVTGPYDYRNGLLTQMIIDYDKHLIPCGITGGFDFVDCRDVADAIIEIIDKEKFNELYLLTGKYYSIKDILSYLAFEFQRKRSRVTVPLFLVYLALPFISAYSIITKKRALFTLYSLNTLRSNAYYSNDKAQKELSFTPRGCDQSIKDAIVFLRDIKKVN